MDDHLARFFTDLIGRVDGPLSFRLVLQPLVAMVCAFRDGRGDARAGRAPYGWAVFTDAEHRRFLIRDGWKGIASVFVFAWLLDLLYQYLALGGWRPAQAFLIAVLLAIVPYALLRGVFNRVLAGMRGGSGGG